MGVFILFFVNYITLTTSKSQDSSLWYIKGRDSVSETQRKFLEDILFHVQVVQMVVTLLLF